LKKKNSGKGVTGKRAFIVEDLWLRGALLLRRGAGSAEKKIGQERVKKHPKRKSLEGQKEIETSIKDKRPDKEVATHSPFQEVFKSA